MKAGTPLVRGGMLGGAVAAVAVFYALSAWTLPVADRRPAPSIIVVALVLLLLHAALYWKGERLRERVGLRIYAGAQAALLFAIITTRLPGPVAVGLLMTGTAELVGLTRGRWSPVHITVAAIALYVVAAFGTSGLYGAATAGLLIALTGATAHAIGALLRRSAASPADAAEPQIPAVPARGRWGDLSPRETAVLSELVRGARNGQIARTLGISERTVKAHLAHIYQKLGVESRSAAVATALKQGLIRNE